jgi:iron complex outermembrane receptor protein
MGDDMVAVHKIQYEGDSTMRITSAFFSILGRLSFLPALLIAASPHTVLAQDVTDEVVDEIVVTAQNREQAVTDVPISMNVVSGEALEAAGVNDLQNLGNLAPDFMTVNDAEATRVSLRGITTSSNDEAQDQSLVVNIDGEYINRPRLMNAGMFDIERVEVLRGPQGTLYGRNATGGAINIIARKPELDGFAGNATVNAGDYNALNFNAGLNIPLGDKAAVRLAVITAKHDAYKTHPNTAGSVNPESADQDLKGARLGLLVEPSDELSIYFAYERTEQDNEAPLHAFTNINTPEYSADDGTGECNTAAGWVEIARQNGGVQCSPNNTNYLNDINRSSYDAPFAPLKGFQIVESDAFRAQVNYDFGNVLLTYRGGYRDAVVDADVPLSPAYMFYRNEDHQAMSNEIRLSGGDDRFFWQGGLFFFKEEGFYASGLLAYIPGPPGPTGFWPNTFYRPDFESDSKSVFGQVDIPVGDTLTTVLGVRYTKDDKSGTYYNLPPGLSFDPDRALRPIDTPGTSISSLSSSDDEITWTAGLNWEPNADTLVYGKISKGYKAGGFDSTGLEYGPETVLALEIGSKNQMDNLTFSGSAFWYDYDDLQVGVLIDTNLGGQVFNAGKVTIWGLEGAVDYYVVENGRLSASLNYLNSEYDDFATAVPVQCLNCDPDINAVGQVNGAPPNLAGNTPAFAPDLILSLGYDHTWELAGGAAIKGSIFSRYKSEYYTTPYNYADGKQSGYTQTDVSLGYESAEGTWGLRAYVRNLEEEMPLTFHSFTSAGPDDIQNWFFGPPRTYGVQFTLDF